jgi:hypothetical protein
MQKTLKSRKTPKDTINSTIKRTKVPRTVSISIPKGQFPDEQLWSCIGMSVQSALSELGVKIDITIRQTEDAYEVIAEE